MVLFSLKAHNSEGKRPLYIKRRSFLISDVGFHRLQDLPFGLLQQVDGKDWSNRAINRERSPMYKDLMQKQREKERDKLCNIEYS